MSAPFVPDRWIPGSRLTTRHEGAPRGGGQTRAANAPARRRPRSNVEDQTALPPDQRGPRIGVLALQGDVLEHLQALQRVGAEAVTVRSRTHLDVVDGLIVPGGESTTIGTLLERFGLRGRLRERIADGFAVMGTCAGMILLSDELIPPASHPLIGGLQIRTRRNAFGRQRDSFEAHIEVEGIAEGPLRGAFIRAPRVEEIIGRDVEVLARVDGFPVVVRQGALLGCAFHPEVNGDDRLHAMFVQSIGHTAGSGQEHTIGR